MSATIVYTTSQLTKVLLAAKCCMAQTVSEGIANDFYYKVDGCSAYEEGTLLQLYILALNNWSQNSDGTVPSSTNNAYSQDAFAAMVGYVARHCGCVLGSGEPAHLAWRGIVPVCETIGTAYRVQQISQYCVLSTIGQNTGQSGYTTLEQFNSSTTVATGVTKPNVNGDPDYVAPTVNLVTCPLPSTSWIPTGPYCVQDSTSHNTSYQGYTTLSQVISGTQTLTGVTKPNVSGDPNYVAPYINLTACPLTVPIWRALTPYCVVDGTSHNTGYRAWRTLQQYYADNGVATGVQKPNLIGDPNYVPPVSDLTDCPLTTLLWRGQASSLSCVKDTNVRNTGYKSYATLEQYYSDTNATTGLTKANAIADPNYIAPVLDTVTCPLPTLSWRVQQASVSCVQTASINTGQKQWATLEQYYTDNGTTTGTTKPNISTDPNYVAPITDTTSCPIPVTITLISDMGTGNTSITSGSLNLVSGSTTGSTTTVSQQVNAQPYTLTIVNDSKNKIGQITITNSDGVQTLVPTGSFASQSWTISAGINGRNTTVEISLSAVTWIADPASVTCNQGTGGNTGYKAWSNLLQQYVISRQLTGLNKPNVSTDPNFIPAVLDLVTCPAATTSTVYSGGDANPYTLANLKSTAYGTATSPITQGFVTTNGQYLWLLTPVSYGTLFSVTDALGSQIISAWSNSGIILIGGISYNQYHINYPTGNVGSVGSPYNLTFSFH